MPILDRSFPVVLATFLPEEPIAQYKENGNRGNHSAQDKTGMGQPVSGRADDLGSVRFDGPLSLQAAGAVRDRAKPDSSGYKWLVIGNMVRDALHLGGHLY